MGALRSRCSHLQRSGGTRRQHSSQRDLRWAPVTIAEQGQEVPCDHGSERHRNWRPYWHYGFVAHVCSCKGRSGGCREGSITRQGLSRGSWQLMAKHRWRWEQRLPHLPGSPPPIGVLQRPCPPRLLPYPSQLLSCQVQVWWMPRTAAALDSTVKRAKPLPSSHTTRTCQPGTIRLAKQSEAPQRLPDVNAGRYGCIETCAGRRSQHQPALLQASLRARAQTGSGR